MTPVEARCCFEAAAEAWANMASIASEREADYQIARTDPHVDPVELVKARLSWGVAHVSASALWVERMAALDRLRQVEAELLRRVAS